ncbi:hypothetical protein AMTRI_Chr03g48060 [Amborella trichopoda]
MHLVFLMNWGSFMLGNIVSVRFHSSLATKMDAAERYRYNPKLEWNPRVKEYFIKAYGEQHFQCICDALTRPSGYSCIRVNNLKSTSDVIIDKLMELYDKNSANSKSSFTNFIGKCQIPSMDYVVVVQGSGPHKLEYGDEPNKPLKEVIVSRKCAEAVLRGAQVYPQYFERCGLYIGQGVAMMSRAGIFGASQGIAIEMIKRVYELPSFYGILKGEIFLQNLPSIITAHVLDPQEGELILDMCAAPGGKTTAIAILMKDMGEVVACDRSHNKVEDVKNLALELGLTCIKAYKLDALKAVLRPTDVPINSSNDTSDMDIKGPQTPALCETELKSDIDKPCITNSIDEDTGICTMNPGENEALVRYALDTYTFLSLAPQHPYVGGPGLVGGSQVFDGEYFEEWLRPGEEVLVQRFDPSASLDTIGFFIAKFNVDQKQS